MKIIGVLVLAPPEEAAWIARDIAALAPEVEVVPVHNALNLDAAAPRLDDRWLLLSFGTSVIVPARVLATVRGRAVNVHAAPPSYPGRDPHHFAAYDAVTEYGATAMLMVERVDAGEILATRIEAVEAATTPRQLLDVGNAAARDLIRDLLPRLLSGAPVPPSGQSWGPRKTRRADFQAMCTVTASISEQEFERRLHACSWPGRHNVTLDLHGVRFREEGPVPTIVDARWSDFTEHAYSSLLELAREHYVFATYDARPAGRHVLWRHDVDFSVHRALRLAQLEAERGLQATYFFMLNGPFYTLRDAPVRERMMAIAALGHHIGLHVVIETVAGSDLKLERVESQVEEQRATLEELAQREIGVVSFHNPEAAGVMNVTTPRLAGLLNVYGGEFRSDYVYCSDSNGYWRFTPLQWMLTQERPERLQVLTHPAWWTPAPMAPRARIERCVIGRARATMAEYDAFLVSSGRENRA